jgi:hypothetical protein
MNVSVLKFPAILEFDARTDKVDPIEKKFTIEKVFTEPNLHIPKQEAPEPNLNAHLIERSEPKFTKLILDSRVPTLAPARKDMLLPNFTRSSTLTEL